MRTCLLCGNDGDDVSAVAVAPATWNGFNNFAEKCDDHGNRVFVIFHKDSAYGSVFAMKDPTCGPGR